MLEIRFQARVWAPFFSDAPPEIIDKWVARSIAALPEAYRHLKKVIKTRKDFQNKIAQPIEKTLTSFINPAFRSKHGRTYQRIQEKIQDSLKGAAKRYFVKRKILYGSGRYEEKIQLAQARFAESWCKFTGPLRGYKAGKIKGLGTLGAMALAGDESLRDYLKSEDCLVNKPVAVIGPDQRGRFSKALANQIVSGGKEIIRHHYREEVIQAENKKLNQLVNNYLIEGFCPFQPGGASHLDFIVTEISHPARPAERLKWLGLDIQVAGQEK